jgi:hypothetical protein
VWGAQLQNGDIATDYIATTTAAVSVGPVSGLPRLDYLGSTCPRLLLEPQRTNLALYSEQFDNAAWGNAGTTPTANQAVSPDGYSNADLVVNSASSNYLFQGIAGSISGTFTTSIFAKKGTESSFAFGLVSAALGSGMGVKFNFDTQTFSTPTNYANFTSISASYQSYGNGWYRLNLTGTTATSTAYFFVLGSLLESFAVNAYVYGAQLEVGAYATSYIPTLGASVTRVAETISKTLVNSNSNFSFFLELDEAPLGTAGGDWLAIAPSTTLGRAFMFQNVFGFADAYATSSPVAGQTKFAWTQVSSTTAKLFSNGVLRSTSTSGAYSNPFNLFSIDGDALQKPVRIKQLIFFDTPISDAQAIELTA